MKTERRHELQTNQLADWIGSTAESVKPYTKVALGGIVALVVIVAVVWFVNRQAEATRAEGWDRYFAAVGQNNQDDLLAVAERYQGTPPGTWARLRLAEIHLATGTNALFNDRAEANEELRKARDYYVIAVDDADSEVAQQRANLGLARTYESLNDLDKARQTYQRLATRWPEGPYAEESRSRLRDLDRPGTKDFYDWFAMQNPQPPSVEDEGFFGDRGFGLDLPDQPNFDSPFDGFSGETPSAPATPGDAPLAPLGTGDLSAPGAPGTESAPVEAEGATP